MHYLGIDIGTTSISCVLTSAAQTVAVKTIPNTAHLPSTVVGEYMQDAGMIASLCTDACKEFLDQYDDIGGIGLSGQMHGIVYVNSDGKAVSPLYAWQDQLGNNVFCDDMTYCEYAKKETGYHVPTGFGLITHFYRMKNNDVPKDAVSLCTIADYVGMYLCQNKKPILHKSLAQSIGFYDFKEDEFDEDALKKIGIDPSILPQIADKEKVIGTAFDKVPVVVAIGDNQAGFFGSVNFDMSMLINVGTSAQISFLCHQPFESEDLECRPHIDGTYLLSGAPLCGGRSYQILRDFFAKSLDLFGAQQPENLYVMMDEAAQKAYEEETKGEKLKVDTRFSGSRRLPHIRGSIQNLGVETFTPGHFCLGVLQGICDELYSYYTQMPKEAEKETKISAGGNAARHMPLLRKLLSETFQKEVVLSESKEQAAFGMAMLAMCCADTGVYNPSLRVEVEYVK